MFLAFGLCLLHFMAQAQNTPAPFKVAKNANHFVYATYDYGEHIDTHYTQIEICGGSVYLVTDGDRLPGEYHPGGWSNGPYIQGYSVEDIFVDERKDSITYLATIFEGEHREHYRTVAPFSRKDIHFDTDQVGGLTRYTCSINSNKLEFYVQPFKTIWHGGSSPAGKESRDLSPVPYYGRFPGLLVSFWRNGQCHMELVKTNREHSSKFYIKHDTPLVTARELSNIKRQKMVITTRVFDSVQLCWCGLNDHIDGNYRQNTPFDSVLHYAGGTLALKRIRLPQLRLLSNCTSAAMATPTTARAPSSSFPVLTWTSAPTSSTASTTTPTAFPSSLGATVSTTKASEKASATCSSIASPRSCTGHPSS